MLSEEPIEVYGEPVFAPGEKVQAIKRVRNDGTYPQRNIGEVLVQQGDVGYVRDIGTFLQRFYVYAVEFVDSGTIVGMRAGELTSLDASVEARDPS